MGEKWNLESHEMTSYEREDIDDVNVVEFDEGMFCKSDVQAAVKIFKKKLRKCDEFFNVKDYNDVLTTDKFIGIVDLFLREVFGEELTKLDVNRDLHD